MYLIKERAPGTCLECGDKIVYGRSDRKFCCDVCKNRYHNRISRTIKEYKSMVNTALERNYGILESLKKMNFRRIPVREMQELGFRVEFFTSFRKGGVKDAYMCYDLQYFVENDVVTSIVRISQEADGFHNVR